MEKSFFEIKYEITRDYYIHLKESYTPMQSAGMCYEDFYEEITENNIEGIIAFSTIIMLLISDVENISQEYIEEIRDMIGAYREIKIEEKLNEKESDYLREDMGWLESYYKKLQKEN